MFPPCCKYTPSPLNIFPAEKLKNICGLHIWFCCMCLGNLVPSLLTMLHDLRHRWHIIWQYQCSSYMHIWLNKWDTRVYSPLSRCNNTCFLLLNTQKPSTYQVSMHFLVLSPDWSTKLARIYGNETLKCPVQNLH